MTCVRIAAVGDLHVGVDSDAVLGSRLARRRPPTYCSSPVT